MAGRPDREEVLFDAVRAYVRRVYGPGRRPVRVVIRLDDGEPISMPVPVPWDQAAAPTGDFIPTPFQQSILDALAGGVALRTDQLAAAVGCDRRSLFRHPGGLKELQEHGLLKNHARLGYYRPDDPPEQLAGESD